jgi:hypothetical protein
MADHESGRMLDKRVFYDASALLAMDPAAISSVFL